MADPLEGSLSIYASTYRLIVCVVPPLLRLGLIDRPGCVLLGAVIGIVFALRSMRFGEDKVGKGTEPTRGSKFGSRFWVAGSILI